MKRCGALREPAARSGSKLRTLQRCRASATSASGSRPRTLVGRRGAARQARDRAVAPRHRQHAVHPRRADDRACTSPTSRSCSTCCTAWSTPATPSSSSSTTSTSSRPPTASSTSARTAATAGGEVVALRHAGGGRGRPAERDRRIPGADAARATRGAGDRQPWPGRGWRDGARLSLRPSRVAT